MNKYRFHLFTVVLMIFFSFQLNVLPVHADKTEKVPLTKEMIIQIMPEYITPDDWSEDGPAVLYGQHGLFVNEEEEPYDGKLSVKIPLDDPTLEVALVGQVVEEGTLDVDYTVNEDDQKVEWIPNEPIQPGEEYGYAVEYYYAPLSPDKYRAFTFEEIIDRNVENMNILFFEPVEAENVQLSKEPNEIMELFDTPVHEYTMNDVKAGDKFELDISYEKDSNITTMEVLEEQAPHDEIHQGFNDNNSNDETGAIISNEGATMISISIVIAGVFIYFAFKNKQNKTSNNKENISTQQKLNHHIEKEKKKLRQQLIDGKIDKETYQKKLSKLS